MADSHSYVPSLRIFSEFIGRIQRCNTATPGDKDIIRQSRNNSHVTFASLFSISPVIREIKFISFLESFQSLHAANMSNEYVKEMPP